jgi:hypothetical protein
MNTTSTIYDCGIIELNKIHNRSGNITAVEGNLNIPFDIRRVYYLYDVPSGAERGGHSHKGLYQLIIAASGCFDVVVNDSRNKKVIELNRPNFGLLIVPGIWSELVNFSSGAISLVLASNVYEESDYIREYKEYKKFKSL